MRLLKKLYRLIYRLRWWYRTIYKHSYKIDLGMQLKIPLLTKIKYNLIGFTDEDYFNFDLKNNDYHDYICYKERLRLENINGHYASLLGEKVMFERMFGRYVNVPHIFCWMHNGSFIKLESGETTDITEILKKNKKLIAKPANSYGGGAGVMLLEFKDDTYFIDRKPLTKKEFLNNLEKCENYIFVAFVESAEYSKTIFEGTANSIRVVSVTGDKGDIDFLFAYHRFATKASFPVDNICSGGVVALIDLKTGILGPAHCLLSPREVYSYHPDTGARIEGTTVPKWHDILFQLEQAHKRFPYYQFFAWDIVLDPENTSWILEINRGTDLDFQMIKPMRHEKLGKYMRQKGLLNNW